jgi:hypothetical protein
MSEHQVETVDKAALHHRVTNTEAAPTTASSAEGLHPLLRLQSQVGNAHIARLIAQRQETEEPEEDEGAGAMAQRQADEEQEPEEEGGGAIAQRQSDEEPEEQGEGGGQIQRSSEVGLQGGPVTEDTEARIHAQRGGGSALDASTRETMERSFGADFDGVRVHSDAESHALNRLVSARAFTTGNDIFLGSQANASDPRLLAHELTHVVQQRSMSGGGTLTVGAAGDPHEQHADHVAEAVTTRPPMPAHPAPTAQREPDPSADVQRAAEDEQDETATAGTAEVQPEEEIEEKA